VRIGPLSTVSLAESPEARVAPHHSHFRFSATGALA
jgi:hypothetical protein